MEKISISESQFRKMVREEGEKIKKEIILRAQLDKIDQELAKLNEVHAGGNMEPGKDGVHAGQKKPVFTKKGTHLVEDDNEEMDNQEMDGEEMGGEETPMDTVVDMPSASEESIETLSKDDIMNAIQDLGNKLDLQGTIEFVGNSEGMEDAEMEVGEENGAEDSIELDVDIEDGAEDAVDSEMSPEGEEEMSDTGAEEELDECGDDTQMEEKKETGMVSENTDPKKQKLNEERERMKFLAGIK